MELNVDITKNQRPSFHIDLYFNPAFHSYQNHCPIQKQQIFLGFILQFYHVMVKSTKKSSCFYYNLPLPRFNQICYNLFKFSKVFISIAPYNPFIQIRLPALPQTYQNDPSCSFNKNHSLHERHMSPPNIENFSHPTRFFIYQTHQTNFPTMPHPISQSPKNSFPAYQHQHIEIKTAVRYPTL